MQAWVAPRLRAEAVVSVFYNERCRPGLRLFAHAARQVDDRGNLKNLREGR
jgi:hypothetical protein